jgi:hypothetical protein
VEPAPDRSLGRRLIAIGAAALVVSLVARALSNELDISPAVTILIVWAVLTVLFAGFVWLRGRRVDEDDEDDVG